MVVIRWLTDFGVNNVRVQAHKLAFGAVHVFFSLEINLDVKKDEQKIRHKCKRIEREA